MRYTSLQTNFLPKLNKFGSFDVSMSATGAAFGLMGITSDQDFCSRVETTSMFYDNGQPFVSCYAFGYDKAQQFVLKRYLWELTSDFSQARFVAPKTGMVARHHTTEDAAHPRADEIEFNLPNVPGTVFVKR
jgi:hypothetical protein